MLHNHSVFSVIDGRGTTDAYLELAAHDNQEFFALTDHGNLGGAIELYTAAKKKGIKPVLGCELYVDAYDLRERNFPGHLTVLAKNEAGWRALIAANNLAHRQFYYRPRLTLKQIVDNKLSENWIILSGCMSGPVNQLTLQEAELIVTTLARHSGGFFLETMWHPSDDEAFNAKQDMYLERVATLHKSTGLPLALTNDCHYAHKYDEDIHNDLLRSSHAPSDLEFDGEGFYFKTTKQMEEIAGWLNCGNAVDNAYSAGMSCDIVIPEADKVNWYVPDITGGFPKEKIIRLCEAHLSARDFGPEYWERYHYELGVLSTSAAILNSYLVASDVIEWCAERNIPIAARGSMAGSLISFLMGITLEDPIKYNLSFSRAVNPARPSIPDFDLDVSSLHRASVLEYLSQRYAGNIPICAYTHYGPKGALRKVLRMEGLRDQINTNELCKTLPDDWPVEAKMFWDPTIKHFNYKSDLPDDGKKIVETGGSDGRARISNRFSPKWLESIPENYIDYINIYEGLYSSMSVHPSGVLISGPERQLEHEVPLQYIASTKILASAYDMYSLKKIGLFKLDVLGLRTLDQLEFMEKVSGTRLPNDDYDEPEVLAAFGADLLAEIFQMDGYACRNVIRDIRGIESFEDIIAANTLARPGCAQFTPFYRSGFEGLIREYPPISDVLKPTNGLILYQEQVMEIARLLADFDDAEQDDVKEAIKYFQHTVWDGTITPKFKERCEAKGYNATNILSAMAKMASYTYNRAHAMTYAAIAYKMMWYKIHFPSVYYAGVFDAADDKAKLILESHFFKVKWEMPNVNTSARGTTIQGNSILLGLGSINGVGPAAFDALEAARPFTSKEDLMARVERRKCNIKVITALQNAYALSEFGDLGTPTGFQESYGFSLSFLSIEKAQELEAWQKENPAFRLGGFVTDFRVSNIRTPGPNHGKEMCRVNIVNISGSKQAICFPDIWKKLRGTIYKGAAVIMGGSYQTNGDFIVEEAKGVS